MATSKDTVDHVLEQLGPLHVRARAMFAEYGVYCDERIVALICDDMFFLKQSPAELGVSLERGPPYPGAKDALIIDADILHTPSEFQRLVQATADALPKPKRKGNKTKAVPGLSESICGYSPPASRLSLVALAW